ncbi:MAG TPA: hypothetical protein VM184_07315 [Gaiellaceae bacterium]|nr:hypothetical protein [Gaiellaceae bacterium]
MIERYEIRELPSGRVVATAATLGGARLAVRTLARECAPLKLSIYDRARNRSVTRSQAQASPAAIVGRHDGERRRLREE